MRQRLKQIVMGGALFLVAPLVLLAWVEERVSRSELLFNFGAQSLALIPGLPGSYLRAAYYFCTLRRSTWEAHIGFGSLFTHRGGCLARRVSIGCYCVLGHADIHEGVMMGSRVSIPSGKRQHLSAAGGISTDSGTYDTVRIGAGSWIGEGAIIMADVGAGCIVAAGAVVSEALQDYSLSVGNPARSVRQVREPPAAEPSREEG